MVNYKWFFYKYEFESEIGYMFPLWQELSYVNYSIYNFYFYNNIFEKKDFHTSFMLSFEGSKEINYSDDLSLKTLLPLDQRNSLINEEVASYFTYLRKSTFISFFINNMIDVPICFKKSIQIRTKNFELPLLKFSNLIMKQGKREQTVRLLFTSFRLFLNDLKKEKLLLNTELYDWISLYIIINSFFWQYFENVKIHSGLPNEANLELLYNNFLTTNRKLINGTFFIKNFLLSRLSHVAPVFSYFIYSVDKNIRKYSRGKSGKYVFIWKYVATYKRLYIAMKWITKDIKFQQNKKISQRLINTFKNLTLTPETSFAWKSKIFSHNYVFKNFKKTLMSNLKTIS